MRLFGCLIGLALVCGGSSFAAENELQLDPSLLEGIDLSDFDEKQLQDICKQLQKRLQGEYIVDLAALRDVARAILPVLDANEEARPYAAWLRARLDYLDVANELRLIIPAPEPDKPTPSPLQPSPVIVR